MKGVFKFLLLPVAISCCSMTSNVTTIRFASFAINEEDDEKLNIRAYVDILVHSSTKVCNYQYYWAGNDGIEHKCGYSAITSLTVQSGYPLVKSDNISLKTLHDYSPITFICEATINGEGTYRTTIAYNSKTVGDFTISEETNNCELTTGYVKEGTFIDPSKNYHYEDTFSFLNFEDLRVNDLYYDLDISYLKFKYRNGLDNILRGDFRFAFYDRYNLFPDFEIGDNMYRYIPLTFNREKEECYFTFTPTIYYNPTTHESSLIKKENYLPTHHLMLPFSYASELKFLPCYLELKVKSHTDFRIYGKFMMTYLKKYFGDCEDSEFCDEMHQDDEINVREKVIEVII